MELFNEDIYLELNPDVKKAGENPREHFLKFGIDEGRPWQDSSKENCSKDAEEISLIGKKILELFNEDIYLELNPDVKKAGENPKEHFLKFGIKEGRPWQTAQNANSSNDPEKILLIDKKTSELFNKDLYLKLNPDVKKAGEDPKEHFLKFGIKEGRPWQTTPKSKELLIGEIIEFKFSHRDDFLSLLKNFNSMLEIGCFDKPSLERFRKKKDVIISYADWLSKEELQERASKIEGRNKDEVPEIKYVLAKGYEQINFNYQAVVSHHCIEHQPNLVAHFNEIYMIIKNKGTYFATIPNKNLCFDHFLPESNVLDIVLAFLERRTKPSFKSVLEHRAFTSRDWLKDENPFESLNPNRMDLYKQNFEEFNNSDYVDVHCWQFTPESFHLIMNQLHILGLINPISTLEIYPNKEEFYIALKFK